MDALFSSGGACGRHEAFLQLPVQNLTATLAACQRSSLAKEWDAISAAGLSGLRSNVSRLQRFGAYSYLTLKCNIAQACTYPYRMDPTLLNQSDASHIPVRCA